MPRALKHVPSLFAVLAWLGAIAWLALGPHVPGLQSTLVGVAATATVIAYLEVRRVDAAETSRLALAAARGELSALQMPGRAGPGR